MKTSAYSKVMFWLSLAGVLFSGYLSAIKIFTSTCAFNEPCPYFLGYPSCWYGFGMFLVIFLTATFGFKSPSPKSAPKIISAVSLLGILFAGYFTIPEIGKLIYGMKTGYSLGLPTCAYGLIFYIIIFILSVWYLSGNRNLNGQEPNTTGSS
ncbi:MAG: hypothetical protein ACREGC_01640 [Minisyncoccia bacterium]